MIALIGLFRDATQFMQPAFDVVPQSGTRVSRFLMLAIREGMDLREALELATVAKVAWDMTKEQLKTQS